jgi:hypothetical protein
MLVLAAQGRLGHDVSHALFANTGDDSEAPETLAYVREVATPYAAEHGIEVVEVRRRYADGREHPTLYETLTTRHAIPIPVRLQNGAPASRTCTAEWKAATLARWRKESGATTQTPAVALIGFSVDEMHRANKRKASAWERIEYPLLDLGLNRDDCIALIIKSGLPVPPKSACWFCPWTSGESWRRMKRDNPARFARCEQLEAHLSAKSVIRGHGPVYLTDWLRPLSHALDGPSQPELGCDDGFCWT